MLPARTPFRPSQMTVPETDATGVSEATGALGDLADTTLPLKASAVFLRLNAKSAELPEKKIGASSDNKPQKTRFE